MTTIDKFILSTPAEKHWKSIGIKNHHGINLSLTSIYSTLSEGIGDFLDLNYLITFCKKAGFSIIQLLPLNDTGLDASPYNALSAIALNPIYIRLSVLPGIESSPKLLARIQKLKTLTQIKPVPYREVRETKLSIFFQFVKDFAPQESSEYQNFKEKNPWLKAYACFQVLKNRNQQRAWETWPEEEKNLPLHDLESHALTKDLEVESYMLLQYFCFKQLKEVKKHAQKNGIYLMGDIPILIARDSSDAWAYRDLFHLDRSCGAPPDMYNELGQNWGFPLYNWERLRGAEFAWWKERLKAAENFYHLYRIDHIVGFFRLWNFPINPPNQLGSFLPESPNDWIPLGKELLKMMLSSTKMLPIGEDLGAIPDGVRECLRDLGICGTKVMRWEYEGTHFLPLENYPFMSMTTTSTHDSEPLRAWWHRFPIESEKWAYQFGIKYKRNLSYDLLHRLLKQSHTTGSLFHINLLQEYLGFYPELSYGDPDQERINIPGTLSEKNWVYRMKPSLEEICTHKNLSNTMLSLVS